MNKILYWVPVFIFAALILAFMAAFLSGRDPNALPSVLIDKPAPVFLLPDMQQNSRSSKSIFQNNITVVNFFASWCAPCRAEAPILSELFKDNSLQVLGIAYKDKTEPLTAFLREAIDAYDLVLRDDSGQSSIDWGLTGVPETFVVDNKSRIRYHYAGQLTQNQLQEIMAIADHLSREEQ